MHGLYIFTEINLAKFAEIGDKQAQNCSFIENEIINSCPMSMNIQINKGLTIINLIKFYVLLYFHFVSIRISEFLPVNENETH